MIMTTYSISQTGDISENTLYEIDLISPRFHTARGITAGNTLEELEAAYGRKLKLTEAGDYDSSYIYTENGVKTYFYLNQNVIEEISIQLY